MKKILHKIIRKDVSAPETGGRITNETVAEHRERILAGGRKFKYPMQYTKHRLLIMSILIVVIAVIGFFGFAGWELYKAQSTGELTYRLTQVLPLPVARVDGELVRYSDYLSQVRSAIHYLQTKEAINFNSDDGRRQLDYQKRLSLNRAVQDAYVAKLASARKITVSNKEVDNFVAKIISANDLGVSQKAYEQVISDYYDWSFAEYKDSLRKQLLVQKVQAQYDQDAVQKAASVLQQLGAGADFGATAKLQSEDTNTKAQGGDIGRVVVGSTDPNGIIAAAAKLQAGQVSGVVYGNDGLYIVKLFDRTGDDLHVGKIFVSYTFLQNKLAELRQQAKVQEFISVPQISNPTN